MLIFYYFRTCVNSSLITYIMIMIVFVFVWFCFVILASYSTHFAYVFYFISFFWLTMHCWIFLFYFYHSFYVDVLNVNFIYVSVVYFSCNIFFFGLLVLPWKWLVNVRNQKSELKIVCCTLLISFTKYLKRWTHANYVEAFEKMSSREFEMLQHWEHRRHQQRLHSIPTTS